MYSITYVYIKHINIYAHTLKEQSISGSMHKKFITGNTSNKMNWASGVSTQEKNLTFH